MERRLLRPGLLLLLGKESHDTDTGNLGDLCCKDGKNKEVSERRKRGGGNGGGEKQKGGKKTAWVSKKKGGK